MHHVLIHGSEGNFLSINGIAFHSILCEMWLNKKMKKFCKIHENLLKELKCINQDQS